MNVRMNKVVNDVSRAAIRTCTKKSESRMGQVLGCVNKILVGDIRDLSFITDNVVQLTATIHPYRNAINYQVHSKCSIVDSNAIRKIIEALGSESALMILKKASNRLVNAPELSEELNLPSSTVYEYLQELEDAALLVKVESGRTHDGHWFAKYKSAVSAIRIHFNRTDLSMELMPNEDLVGRIIRLWSLMGK